VISQSRKVGCLDIDQLKRQILFNCDVTDAQYSGIYSVCGLVMRLRDLYKWERRLPPWQEDASASVLDWIGDKETRWEGLMEADYRPLPVNGHSFDAFDTTAVNRSITALNFYYGAGYAHSLKPTFFLAEIDDRLVVDDRAVWVLGREHARDLLTLPAFSQDDQVVLRTEAGRMYLWDQILYMSNSRRRALDYALEAFGFQDYAHETIQRHFDDIWDVQKAIYIHHEVGEIEDRAFDRKIWQQMLADYPHTAVELFIRTLKDLLADTNPKGTLAHLIAHRNNSGLGLYMAFGNGITRMLTKELICAFDAFTTDADWDRIADASKTIRANVEKHTRRVVEIYQQNRTPEKLTYAQEVIEGMMRKSALIR
jgi:hypothetical protein